MSDEPGTPDLMVRHSAYQRVVAERDEAHALIGTMHTEFARMMRERDELRANLDALRKEYLRILNGRTAAQARLSALNAIWEDMINERDALRAVAQAAAAYRDMWHGGDFGGGPLAIGAAWQVLDAALAAARKAGAL